MKSKAKSIPAISLKAGAAEPGCIAIGTTTTTNPDGITCIIRSDASQTEVVQALTSFADTAANHWDTILEVRREEGAQQ